MFSFLLFPHRGCQNVCQRTCWKSQYCHLHADADLTTAFRKGKCVNMDCCCCFLVAQLCLTLLWPCGLQPTRLNHPWNFPGKNTGMGCHFLLQEICPTQGLNPCLPHCRLILYCLSHQGNPKTKMWSEQLIQNEQRFNLCSTWPLQSSWAHSPSRNSQTQLSLAPL